MSKEQEMKGMRYAGKSKKEANAVKKFKSKAKALKNMC